jgi:hypothetical protein
LWPLVIQEGLPRWFQQYAELEQIATSLRLWEPLIIPGLLQTPEYAQELISAWQAADGKETTAEQVEARVQRQEVLDREHPPLCWAVIGEAALRNPVGGPAVLASQLQHILDVEADHPRLVIQVVLSSAGAHPGLEGPLAVVARPDEADIAYLEAQGQGRVMDRSDDVGRYSLLYDLIRSVALSPDDSRMLIADITKELQ